MREFACPAVASPSFAVCLVVAIAVIPCSSALAQAVQTVPAQLRHQPASIRQIALTEKQIQGLLAASNDMDAITDAAPEDIDRLSAETKAKLDVVARKNGLASYDEYLIVDENIALVTSGLDAANRKYVGKEARIVAQIAKVRADKKMSPVDKKETLTDLNDQLQFPLPPVRYKGNIDLVVKYYDRIDAKMRHGD
jgi:hypothetical protein